MHDKKTFETVSFLTKTSIKTSKSDVCIGIMRCNKYTPWSLTWIYCCPLLLFYRLHFRLTTFFLRTTTLYSLTNSFRSLTIKKLEILRSQISHKIRRIPERWTHTTPYSTFLVATFGGKQLRPGWRQYRYSYAIIRIRFKHL